MGADIEKDIEKLKSLSDANMKRMFRNAGDIAVEALPDILARHKDLFRLSIFHVTDEKNLSGIVESGRVYSYDAIKKMKKEVTGGMTVAEDTLCKIFNTVSHQADEYTNFVYARPLFGGQKARGTGLYWEDRPLQDDMWFSFTDPNQTTFDDKYYIEMGIRIVKSFNPGDVYMGEDIPKAIALAALSSLAQIDYLARMNEFRAEQEKAREGASFMSGRKLRPSDSTTLSALAEYYSDITVDPRRPYDVFERAYHWGDDAEKAAIEKAGLFLDGLQAPRLRAEVLAHPEFDTFFAQRCKVLMEEIASYGQIAIATEIETKSAQVYKYGKVLEIPAAREQAQMKM